MNPDITWSLCQCCFPSQCKKDLRCQSLWKWFFWICWLCLMAMAADFLWLVRAVVGFERAKSVVFEIRSLSSRRKVSPMH